MARRLTMPSSTRHNDSMERPRNKVSPTVSSYSDTSGSRGVGIHARRAVLGGLTAGLLIPCARARAADALAEPRGDVIMTVTGEIAVTNAAGAARLDRELLLGMGATELTTATPFTDGVDSYMGVLASHVLDRLGATGTQLRASALNDYEVTIPVADVRDFRALLALDRAGRPLSVRERGPIWLVYPWSEFPELDDRVHRQRSIWQLTRIAVT